MHVSLRGGRDGLGIAGGMDLDHTCHLMGLDWYIGVCMKMTVMGRMATTRVRVCKCPGCSDSKLGAGDIIFVFVMR